MADVQLRAKGVSTGNNGHGAGRSARRLGIRIDMTPMVDVAFLLLIFFMVTTVFRQPLAMEINMPESETPVRVPESNVMTLYVDSEDQIQYRVGAGAVEPIPWSDLYSKFRTLVEANPELIVLTKIHRDARYDSMVEVMDILDDAHMERFSLLPMDPEDMDLLNGLEPSGDQE
jgi:biopolymer transport protein ExbD